MRDLVGERGRRCGDGWASHLHESVGGGVHDLQQLHQRRAIVGDGDRAVLIVDQLVHAAGPERGAHDVDDGLACVDVTDQLRFALRRVRPLLEQNDLRLHHRARSWQSLHLRQGERRTERRQRR